MGSAETVLKGGRVTQGVVRIGDTVRRPITSDRAHVHDLLFHLEHKHFEGTPRFLGVDDQNREILSFLPGDVPRDLGHFADPQLIAAAGLLRRFHDATADFRLVRDNGAEVMCHNDFGPTNAVFRDELPYGLIDFDTVTLGLRLWDLGYSAFAWLDLGNPDYSADEQIRRLSIMAKAYGMPEYSVAQITILRSRDRRRSRWQGANRATARWRIGLRPRHHGPFSTWPSGLSPTDNHYRRRL